MILYLIFVFFSNPVFASEACIDSFMGSQRAFQIEASRNFTNKDLWPQFTSVQSEKLLEAQWNKSSQQVPLFNSLLPHGARFIGHRLRESQSSYFVKISVDGSNLMLRLAYRAGNKDLQTNVMLNNIGISHNIGKTKIYNNYLIGPNVPAAVVFLHGGGTKSTGGHVAESMGNHFAKYNVGVFSPDLPWHGEGPRVFMGDLLAEISALSELVKRYIHPQVPVFLWGHSWGASLADKVMQMSGEKEEGFFHNNLKGLIITSPAVDTAPGASYQTKKEVFERLHQELDNNLDKVASDEINIYRDMVYDGKTSPLGGFFASLTISQIDGMIPSHRGDKYIPSLMVVGTGDPMVYVGFEELFQNYYGQLSNVEAHFLDKLPLIQDPSQIKTVGHLLGNYRLKGVPVNLHLGQEFIEKNIGQKLGRTQSVNRNPVVEALKLYSTDFSFREYVNQDFFLKSSNTKDYVEMKTQQVALLRELNSLLRTLHPKSYLSEQLSVWLERLEKQQTEPDKDFSRQLTEFKSELLKLKELLPADHEKFIHAFNEETQLQELIVSTSSFISGQNLKEVKKNKNSFTDSFYKLASDGASNEFWDRYFYITSAQKQEMKTLLNKFKEIEQKTQHEYTPTAQELSQRLQSIESKEETELSGFPDLYYRWLESESANHRDKIVDQIIEEIKANIQLRKQKKNEIFDLNTEMKALIQDIQSNTLKISHYISQLKKVFSLANANPPHSLKKHYEQSHQQFEELYSLSEKLEEKTNETWVYYLENRIFDEKSLEKMFEPNEVKALIKEFGQKFQAYVEDRKKLREELVEFLKNKGQVQDQSYLEVVEALYGDLGLYEVTNSKNIELAEKESHVHSLNKEVALLVNEYNDYLFAPPIYYWEVLSIKDIFNQEFSNTEIQRKHLTLILGQWKKLKSRLLPSIPE